MCLVEVDTGRGPPLQPACMIPVADGMKVDTESEVTKKAQDGVLEFLLINHPLDCPVCDKGGECPLQDQTLAFGPGESRFVEEKRHYEKPIPLSPTSCYLDRERCILCDRCTRFADEVAGDPLIRFIDRGNETQVNTFPDEPFASYFSGNTVQICPVGALTADALPVQGPPVGPRPGRVDVHLVLGRLPHRRAVVGATELRALPRRRRRPGQLGLAVRQGPLRLRGPQQRRPPRRAAGAAPATSSCEASWAEALGRGGRGACRPRAGRRVAVLGGARLTNEDAYAWSKLARTVLGTDDVDCQLGDGLPAEVVLGLPRATIDEACAADVVVLLGRRPQGGAAGPLPAPARRGRRAAA